jgi:hypothetical protein
MKESDQTKMCLTCGRVITWRKKWADCWAEVRYCSANCRKQAPASVDRDLEACILALLEQRAKDFTICPSEAARRVFGEEHWQSEMERTRCAARRLVNQGKIVITQKGQVVDPSFAKGPIRLRRK